MPGSRSGVLVQADAQLAEVLAAKAAAEQEAKAAREAAQARVAAAERDAEERVAVAESRAGDAGQEAARTREAAQAAHAELDRARVSADVQLRQARQDAARDQAELRAGLEAQVAAAEEARAGLQPAPSRPRLNCSGPVPAPGRRPGSPPPGSARAARAAVGALRKAENPCRPPQEQPGPQAEGQASSWLAFLLTSSLPSMISSGRQHWLAGAS